MTTPTLVVDYTRDTLFTKQAMDLLKENYMLPDEKSPQDALARAALAYCYGDFALAQRIYDYASKGWFMYASPVLSNAPKYGEKPKALPISCFLTHVSDDLNGLIEHNKEVSWLSVKGGGIGGHWSDVRSVSKKAPGPIPFLKVVDSQMTAYQQGSTRRGSYAAYLDVSHPDIMEFLNIRVPTGGDENRKTFNLHNAVNITDAFMEAVEKNKNWKLIDPADGTVRDTIKARELWQRILETRFRTGEPYLHFIDETNRKLNKEQRKLGLRVNGSNLCVSGSTFILTKEFGQVSIKDVEGKEVTVWNGFEWSLVKVLKTNEKATLMQVNLILTDHRTNFLEKKEVKLLATPYHKWFVFDNQTVENPVNIVTTLDLTTGTELEDWYDETGNLWSAYVESVTLIEGTYPTFCYDETIRHRGYFNGVITGNCSEITLPTSPERTAVCCLSSVNLEKYDEWKDTSMVGDLIEFLDNVLQFFIDNAPDELAKAKFSATQERSLGLGAMGFHSYLQSKGIPFESAMAVAINRSMFNNIYGKAKVRSNELGCEKGEAPDLCGKCERNAHLLAIAPNANNSIILGTSSSVEPIKSNAYAHRTRAGTHVVKNKYLEPVLEKYGKNDEETWKSIVLNQGSVQHLQFLSDDERATFKTAFELDQHWVVEQAAKRQEFICQAQSVNLFFPAGAEKSYVNSVHLKAWRDKLKTLYYLRTSAGVQVKVEKKERVALKDGNPNECLSCQG